MLLSEDFAEYSKKILEVKKEYEKKKQAFKELYVQHKAELSELEEEVKLIQEDWNNKLGDS